MSRPHTYMDHPPGEPIDITPLTEASDDRVGGLLAALVFLSIPVAVIAAQVGGWFLGGWVIGQTLLMGVVLRRWGR